MSKLNKINQLLERNYNFKKFKYEYFAQTSLELGALVSKFINKYGNKVDLNNINVSNVDDFSFLFFK
jgi:hypothetical protein